MHEEWNDDSGTATMISFSDFGVRSLGLDGRGGQVVEWDGWSRIVVGSLRPKFAQAVLDLGSQNLLRAKVKSSICNSI
jgi:hypothetical protein